MLSKLYSIYPEVKITFDEASYALGYDLWDLVQKGTKTELNKTYKTQPALLASTVSIWRIWRNIGGNIPKFMSGHSHGEYSALVCSGSLNFIEAIKLVEFRGKLMQEAVPIGIGAMSVIIGLKLDIIYYICKNINNENMVVEPVIFNTLNQVVVSGHKLAVQKAEIDSIKAGAKKIFRLSVSVPSHCILMKSVSKKFSEKLKTLSILTPKIPIINNVDVRIERDPIFIKNALVRQIYNPVRWNDIIKYFLKNRIQMLLEMGPGNILTNFIKKNNNYTLKVIAINDHISLKTAIQNQNFWRKNEF
ncbi:MAG: [acyl-carrier-protein] S-malonyltransferase [Candidatus Westeberhardia cardiocondylae]|nr:[acyl-carrier-protein] S-malonyltransferase [Candidatus Westeberhardia cardiocondylae]